MDGDRATGLVAEGKDGSVYTATAKAVLLASGGFGANQEMVDQYYPQYAGRSFNCCPASTGDGIVLGQKVGAGIECMGRELGAYMSTTSQAGSRMEIAFMYQTTPGIMVNAHGDQFGNVMKANPLRHRTGPVRRRGQRRQVLLDHRRVGRGYHDE